MKWARQNYAILPLYHIFVEDDFFVCTEHLLYQTTLLRNLPPDQRKFSFRTGFPMWDGFDDSSSFLTRDIVQVFADNYPLDHFNCTSLADSGGYYLSHPVPTHRALSLIQMDTPPFHATLP